MSQQAMQILDQQLVGNASALGVMDRGGDVIAPGAFRKSIRGFLSAGFIGLAHDWDSLPIAMPEFAEEVGGFLRVIGRFHSTAAAQEARTVLMERLGHGLSVGLSIGFRAGRAEEFGSGSSLLRSCKDLAGLDRRSISAWRGPCRLVFEVAELFEVSVVAVPMNPDSGVLGAKAVFSDAIRAQQEFARMRLRA